MQILQDVKQTTVLEGAQDSVKVGLSERKIQELSRFFRDKIYNDKPLAAIRETICNAVDEHRQHNISKNVLIHLPTESEPWFSCRDFAKGLSKNDVFSVFFQYGESTKTNSRDSIGGFGIGAKAPFAYVKEFTVTSWHGGNKSVYVGVDQGQDCTANLVWEEPSNEPTGIEVKWDVEKLKITDFIRKFNAFYSHFCTHAELDGVTYGYKNEFFDRAKKIGVILESSQLYSSAGCEVLHKGVLYSYAERGVLSFDRLCIYVPDGVSLDISQSRESLEHTEKNKNVLLALIEKARQKVHDEYQQVVPKNDRDLWKWVCNSENYELINEFRRWNIIGSHDKSKFSSERRLSIKKSACIKHNLRFSSNTVYKNNWYGEIHPENKILFVRKENISKRFIEEIGLKYGANHTLICCQPVYREYDPTTKKPEEKEYLFSDFLDDLKTSLGFDYSDMVEDCTDFKIPRRPRQKSSSDRSFEALAWNCSESHSHIVISEKSLNENGPYFYVKMVGYDVHLSEREKQHDKILESIGFLAKKMNISIIGIRKSAWNLIDENGIDVMPIIKAMRRHAHKAIDWSFEISKFDSKDVNFLSKLGKSIKKPNWPFKNSKIKEDASDNFKNLKELCEKHRKLKTEDLDYAAWWAVVDYPYASSLDFKLDRNLLLNKIKEQLKK